VQNSALISQPFPTRGQQGFEALPSDLSGVVTAWPALPEHIKAAVLALVGTVKN